jgi:hypothetical protein
MPGRRGGPWPWLPPSSRPAGGGGREEEVAAPIVRLVVSRERVKSGSGSVWLLLPGSCVLLQHERFVGNEPYL